MKCACGRIEMTASLLSDGATDPGITHRHYPNACQPTGDDATHYDYAPDDGDPLTRWWLDEAAREAAKLVPKAQEYGSYDLELLGRVLTENLTEPKSWTRPEQMELGIAFYLTGKLARVMSALREGKLPSEDTLRDVAIYARMVLYIREHGRWP